MIGLVIPAHDEGERIGACGGFLSFIVLVLDEPSKVFGIYYVHQSACFFPFFNVGESFRINVCCHL